MVRATVLFAALALLSALIVRGMIGVGVLDRPDAGQPGARRVHDRPIPKGGGVGVAGAVLAGVIGATALGEPVPHPAAIAAAFGIALLAFLDDIRSWSFAVKLGGQVLAAAAAVWSGLVVDSVLVPGWGAVDLGLLAMPFTLAWIVFATNAMNFIDGLNGLASGASLLSGLALAALVAGAPAAGGVLLAAGLAGFLPFNFPRARVFMGDVGSQFCGFALAVLAVACGPAFLIMPALLFGILFDVAFTLVRRTLAGERVTQAHRGHLYQVAQRSGVPASAVALVHWLFVLWGAGCAALAFGRSAPWALAWLLPPQVVWAGFAVWRARRAGLGR